MILAILLTLGALVWLPAGHDLLIVGAIGGLWLLLMMLGAPVAGRPQWTFRAP